MLSLGKMHINLALSHFKKDHSLVIIQLDVPAIFSPIFSSTLNFCWHQKRGYLSAGCCSLLVFTGIRIVPITWGCWVFLEPAALPGFHSVWSGWEGDKAIQSLSLTPSGGGLALPHANQPWKVPLVLTAVSAGAALSSTRPGNLWVDGGMRATVELEAAGEGPSFSWLLVHFPSLLKKWVLPVLISLYTY